jgi:aryl-alcohol dehydrogenase-like predicted oxidoreductase
MGDTDHETTSHAILDHALEAGINLIDTANVYGLQDRSTTTRTPSATERRLGGERLDQAR